MRVFVKLDINHVLLEINPVMITRCWLYLLDSNWKMAVWIRSRSYVLITWKHSGEVFQQYLGHK